MLLLLFLFIVLFSFGLLFSILNLGSISATLSGPVLFRLSMKDVASLPDSGR